MLDAQMRGRDEARANALSDTQSGHELPDDASTGEGPVVTDRDTPTEMFVRDVHGDLIETDSTPGDATKATVVAGFSAPSPNGPAAAGSTDFSTMALPATSFGVPGVPVDPASRLDSADTTAILDLPSSGGARTIPNARTSSPQLMTDSGSHSAFRSSGAPTGGSPLIAAAPAFGPMPAGLERPTFQAKLDRALANVGQTGNRAALRILARFRGASPEQQIIIVIVAAASLAFIAVIALWLILA
jgi:hypothetical protein